MVTKASFFTQIANVVKIINETYKYGQSLTPNIKSMFDAIIAAHEGNHVGSTQQNLDTYRSNFSSILAGSTSLLDSLILELAREGYNSLASTVSDALDDISDGMHSGSETIVNRAVTFGTIAPDGSNVGDGSLYRVIDDKDDYRIERMQGGTTKVECQNDKNTGGNAGAEEFLIFGDGTRDVDEIELGDAPQSSLTINSRRSSDSLLENSSFNTFTGTGSGGDFEASGWTVDSQSNFDGDIANYFRAPASGDPASLKFLDNSYIEQTFSINSVSLDITKPVLLVVRFNRATGSCDGNLQIRLGSKTKTVALSAQTGWNDLVIGIDANNYAWYQAFKEDSNGGGVRVRLTLSARTSGTLLIDEVVLTQPDFFDNAYYAVFSGEVDFLKKDFFTVADSVSDTGIIQYWLNRLYNKYLPHTSGVPTYPDPT